MCRFLSVTVSHADARSVGFLIHHDECRCLSCPCTGVKRVRPVTLQLSSDEGEEGIAFEAIAGRRLYHLKFMINGLSTFRLANHFNTADNDPLVLISLRNGVILGEL